MNNQSAIQRDSFGMRKSWNRRRLLAHRSLASDSGSTGSMHGGGGYGECCLGFLLDMGRGMVLGDVENILAIVGAAEWELVICGFPCRRLKTGRTGFTFQRCGGGEKRQYGRTESAVVVVLYVAEEDLRGKVDDCKEDVALWPCVVKMMIHDVLIVH